MKYRISYTCSKWEGRNGWQIQYSYMGFDDDIYNEKPDYTEDDFIDQLTDQTSFNVLDLSDEEIAAYINDETDSDTRYECRIYQADDNGEELIAEYDILLSDLCKKYCADYFSESNGRK